MPRTSTARTTASRKHTYEHLAVQWRPSSKLPSGSMCDVGCMEEFMHAACSRSPFFTSKSIPTEGRYVPPAGRDRRSLPRCDAARGHA